MPVIETIWPASTRQAQHCAIWYQL